MFSCSIVYAQAKSGVENYNFLSRGQKHVWMPVLHYETRQGVYAELRYNYEDVQTLSIFGGKTIRGSKSLIYVITPMVGFSIGKFTGFSLAANTEFEWSKFYLSCQSQYSIATEKNTPSFFFNWSEIGYNLSPTFFAGLAMQYTGERNMSDMKPGLMMGLNFNNFSLPCYFFKPFGLESFFIVALNFECNFKKRK